MARRRPFRRLPRRRRPPRPPLPPQARQSLIHANDLLDKGQFAEAARIFGRLSEGARRHGRPLRAANLALRAAQAYLVADDVEAALVQAERTIRLLARGGPPERVPRVLSRIAEALRERGYEDEADQLTHYADQVLKGVGRSLDEMETQSPRVTERRASLPDRCGGCGASLIPDDVEWHDTRTAECPYCGAIVKAGE